MMDLDACASYSLGVFDALSLSGAICPVSGSATASAIGVAIKFFDDHPERWSQAPTFLLREAFKRAYPCRR